MLYRMETIPHPNNKGYAPPVLRIRGSQHIVGVGYRWTKINAHMPKHSQRIIGGKKKILTLAGKKDHDQELGGFEGGEGWW